LEARTAIPAHLPLDVLAARLIVPRDTPAAPLESLDPGAAARLTPLDERVAIPKALPAVTLEARQPVAIQDLPRVLDPDVLTTGEINLMVAPVEKPTRNWNWVARTGSIAFHMTFVVLLLLQPKLFPYRPPTQEEVDIARRQLSFIYMPPDVRGLPPEPREMTPPIRIDPRVLREAAPRETPSLEALQPPPEKAPEPDASERLEAPAARNPAAGSPSPGLAARQPEPGRAEVPRTITPSRPEREEVAGLLLPRMSSPGRALEQSTQQAIRGGGGLDVSGGPMPGNRGGTGADGYAGAGIQMLTPTEGVDFSSYLARVLASVKRNWYAVMPESARLGDRGRVVLQFRIMRDGIVPTLEPVLAAGSGRDPLDRAAISAIRTSSPFGPLPPSFSGQYIELRFIFLYNLPLDYQ
jgi:TonB family protein